MHKKTKFFTVFFLLFILKNFAFSAAPAAEYLCEMGIAYYRSGRYEDALGEFEKALMIEPDNLSAKTYIGFIFKKEVSKLSPKTATTAKPPKKSSLKKLAPKEKLKTSREEIMSGALTAELAKKSVPAKTEVKEKSKPGREEIMNNALASLDKEMPVKKPEELTKKEPPFVLNGEYRLALGFTPHDVIWKDTNADNIGVPREKNWRYLWGEKRENTYDPKIYDRLTVDMKTQFDNSLNAFMEMTADPWTFIGKNHVTVISGSDSVDLDVKYWSADHRTINETYRSNQGKIIQLKQIKVHDGETTLSGLTISPTTTEFGTIQPMDVKRQYRPFRKFWFDYKQDNYSLKVFPLSDQFEAFTTDDPLRLSNNHVYWEENPWLDKYEPSRTFDAAGNPIKRGKWIRKLSFFSKDSSDDYPHRLTFLRGASFKADTANYSLDATMATPMSLWDNYNNSNSVDAAVRLKVPLKNDLQLGLTTTSKVGLNKGGMEALNQLEGVDLNYNFLENNTVYAAIAYSNTDIQEAKDFNTNYDGLGAKLGFNYNAYEEKKQGIYKSAFSVAFMDKNFYPALSNYRYTRRDDPTWSRHVYFAEIAQRDKELIWGDGIDRGRLVLGAGLNFLAFNEKLDTDIKFRNVRKVNPGKYVESVLRTETTYKVNSRLSSKILTYYQNLHRTHANEDPVLYEKTMYSLSDYFSDEDLHPTNASIVDGKDPSIGSFGLGLKYDLLEKIFSIEGVYERTNESQDFPRSLLNDVSVTTEVIDGQTYDKVAPFLYDQKFFDMPPYNYYNIAKTKFIYTPNKLWEFILGYTFNENNHAAGIDDNINHIALETKYMPTAKWTFWLKYIYSGVVDIYKQNQYQRSDFFDWHHNVFFGSEYMLNKDESFSLLYGEFVGYNDPYEQGNWSLSTLDTQHIFRMFYKRKF